MEVGSKIEEQIVAIGAPTPSLCPKSTKEQGISLELQDKGDKQGRKGKSKLRQREGSKLTTHI